MQETPISREELKSFFDNSLHSRARYLYPESNESVEARVVSSFQQFRDEGSWITLVDGAFDVPHNSHEWYLRHCKFIGAYAYLQAASDVPVKPTDLFSVINNDADLLRQTKLAVTVDADEKVASKKSGLSNKGGVQRPIYPWSGRADRLLGYHFTTEHAIYQTVDLITVEGDSIHRGTPLESSLALAAFLGSEGLLDTFIVYGEHQKTIDEADDLGLAPIIIDDAPYEINPQTGQGWSSSALIRRAQGNPVAHPITRPRGL